MSKNKFIVKNMKVYIDGGQRPSTGLGGYGILIIDDKGAREVISGTQENTTNNVMELKAFIEALKLIKERGLDKIYEIEIYSDSQYVVKGTTEWYKKWSANNFKTSSGDSVKNLSLWKEIEKLKSEVKCTLVWIRGHADSEEHNNIDKVVYQLTDPTNLKAKEVV